MRYLARIKDDALHGRAPTAVDFVLLVLKPQDWRNQNLSESNSCRRQLLSGNKMQMKDFAATSPTTKVTPSQGRARRRCASGIGYLTTAVKSLSTETPKA
jgi:hypothetical protein